MFHVLMRTKIRGHLVMSIIQFMNLTTVHFWTGHMCSFDSAAAPEFALHHSFMDKIWTDWQRRSRAHLNAHFPRVATNMPGTGGLHPRDVLDNSRLPGGVRVDYQVSQGVQSRGVLQSLGGNYLVDRKKIKFKNWDKNIKKQRYTALIDLIPKWLPF